MSHSQLKVSLIISTYNQSSALKIILNALSCQDCDGFEVIIADDGSGEETHNVITKLDRQLPITIKHVWQEDQGFRLATIRNKAASQALGNYLIFLDGDCIPPKTFIRRHIKLAEKKWFVTGNRVYINENLTSSILNNNLQPCAWSKHRLLKARLKGQINRLSPLIYVPLGKFRKRKAQQWDRLLGCNLGIWRQDFITVNGFDEGYEGWGNEDSDIAYRLIHSGIKRKLGQYATAVLHLWHPIASREHVEANSHRFKNTRKNECIVAKNGVSKYL